MRIRVIGDCDSARVLRGLLRKAGFAVTEILPAALVTELPSGGYVVHLAEGDPGNILFDSVDSELERNILRHVTQLSPNPVVVDRPGGEVRSDREIRIVLPRGDAREAAAVEFGGLRGLMDTVAAPNAGASGQGGGGWLARLRRAFGGQARMPSILP